MVIMTTVHLITGHIVYISTKDRIEIIESIFIVFLGQWQILFQLHKLYGIEQEGVCKLWIARRLLLYVLTSLNKPNKAGTFRKDSQKTYIP